MFESLTASLSSALNTLRGRGRLSEANMREGLTAVRTALLEADVAYEVADGFLARVAADAVGAKVLESLDPAQQLVGIVHRELMGLMGPVDHSLHLEAGRTTVLMLCGLQGSGKTTSCAKLARRIKEQGRGVMLVAADLQRPAAIEQLAVLGRQLGVPVHLPEGATDPVAVCNAGVARARREGASVVILDTAGRLAIDAELMRELATIDRSVGPDQVYLVVDAMTGQDAVRSAKAFNDALEIDGVIMTKLDGDARGGAALSVREVTGKPIVFMGVGEKVDALQPFDPERVAGRILGMGDVVALVEQVQGKVDAVEAERLARKVVSGQKFDFYDLKGQLEQLQKMGGLGALVDKLPAHLTKGAPITDQGDQQVRRQIAIINSMTHRERRKPDLIDGSRRRRIAAGSGTQVQDVNRLLKQFAEMQRMMKSMKGGKLQRMLGAFRGRGGPPGLA
jgi:signal recognition particle subunit SRP54